MFIDVNQILLTIRYVLRNRTVWFHPTISLLSFLFIFCAPAYFLYYVVHNIVSVLSLRFVIRPVGVIDMGQIFHAPLVAFKVREQYFRIGLFPYGVFIDGVESFKCEILSGLLVLVLSFSLSTLAFWMDGWPDLQTAQSTVTSENSNPQFTWKTKLKSTGVLKVLDVEEDSVASKMGLKYGDIIVAVNNVLGPTISSFSDSIINSDRIDLQVLDQDGSRTITLERDSKGSKKSLFGFAVGPSFQFQPEVLVQAVQFNGEAFKIGIKPGDLLAAPQASYLSNGVLSSGWRDRKFDSIVVIRPTANPDKVVTQSDHPVLKQIPTSSFSDHWTESLVVIDRYERYRPTLLESLDVSLACFLTRFPLFPRRGSDFDVLHSKSQVAGFNPFWSFAKEFSFVSAFFASVFFLSSLCGKLFGPIYWLLPWGVLLLLDVGQGYARVPLFDSLILKSLNLLPLADMLLVINA